MGCLTLLLSLRFWFWGPRWSRAEFVLTSSLLMSDSKPKLSYIIQGVFLFSLKHYSTLLYLCLLQSSRSHPFWRGYIIQYCIFSLYCWLKVTFVGHSDKAILPTAQTNSTVYTEFPIFPSLHMLEGHQGCSTQSKLRQSEVSLTLTPWHPQGSIETLLSCPLHS